MGQKIGKAIVIEAYSSAPEAVAMRNVLAAKSGNALQADSMPDLNFNDVRVNQNVTVRFVLE